MYKKVNNYIDELVIIVQGSLVDINENDGNVGTLGILYASFFCLPVNRQEKLNS